MQRLRIRKEKYIIRNSGGFTFIELITVLLIVGILAAVAASATFYRTDARELGPQVELFKGHLRYAQAMAMQSDKNWGIFVIDGSTYCLFRDGNTDNRILLPGENSLTYSLPSGFTISPAGAVVSFSSGWGVPSANASGSPVAASNITGTMAKGSDSATITIMKNTGFIP
jgi:prepilin-type N-terminal cleavage/methylation domain-containing protein